VKVIGQATALDLQSAPGCSKASISLALGPPRASLSPVDLMPVRPLPTPAPAAIRTAPALASDGSARFSKRLGTVCPAVISRVLSPSRGLSHPRCQEAGPTSTNADQLIQDVDRLNTDSRGGPPLVFFFFFPGGGPGYALRADQV